MTSQTNRTSNTTTTAVIAATTAAILSTCTTAFISLYIHKRLLLKQHTKLNEQRQAERTGRIRAEVKLRTCLKDIDILKQKCSSAASGKNDDAMPNEDDPNQMALKTIGIITSPFTKRMGTPRQGALAPHSRGYLQLLPTTPIQTLEGIEQYSHVWILFKFHANTDLSTNKKTKIKPPRGGGIKVGMLATRSPHRINCIGLSLVNVDRLDLKEKRLYISALDLVNGTPVYDVKPCVPWDIPGHFDASKPLTVPTWVSQDDALSSVTFLPQARSSLEQLVKDGYLAPLYKLPKKSSLPISSVTTITKDAELAMCEVLAQDPRASNTSDSSKKRGNSSGGGGEGAVSAVDPYKIIFCSVQLEFIVDVDGIVQVLDVKPVDFEGVEFVDGVPLVGTSVIEEK